MALGSPGGGPSRPPERPKRRCQNPGPDGLASSLRESAQEQFALGPQTWPHLLVRAMLAEQIYRAFAILSGHPYHRGRPG